MNVQSNTQPYKLSQPGASNDTITGFPTSCEAFTIPKNLYHLVARVQLDEPLAVCLQSVLLDTYPMAIPVDILAKEDQSMVDSRQQKFKSPFSKHMFTPNPAFCLQLVAQALTSGGKGKLDDISDGQMLTCGPLLTVQIHMCSIYMYYHIYFSVMDKDIVIFGTILDCCI